VIELDCSVDIFDLISFIFYLPCVKNCFVVLYVELMEYGTIKQEMENVEI